MSARRNRQLPAPVQRYVARAWVDRAGSPATLRMIGRGSVRLGPLPPLPILMSMSHRLGHDYVGLIRLRVGGVKLLRVIDAYVDGAGITKIGPAATIGPEIDQGAFLGMWAAAIAYPSAWDGVEWREIDADTAAVSLPFGDGAELATVRFDRETAMPVRFEADRYKGASGRKVRWVADSTNWAVFGAILAPRRVTAWWSDEPTPWFEMHVLHGAAGIAVDGALNVGRRVLAAARHRH